MRRNLQTFAEDMQHLYPFLMSLMVKNKGSFKHNYRLVLNAWVEPRQATDSITRVNERLVVVTISLCFCIQSERIGASW